MKPKPSEPRAATTPEPTGPSRTAPDPQPTSPSTPTPTPQPDPNPPTPGTPTPDTEPTPDADAPQDKAKASTPPDLTSTPERDSGPTPKPKPAPSHTTQLSTAKPHLSWPQAVPHQQSPAIPQPPTPPVRPVPAARPAQTARPTPRPAARPTPRPATASRPTPAPAASPAPAPPRARAHTPYPGTPTPPHHSQHRQQPDDALVPEPAAPKPLTPDDRRALHRSRATGFTTGVLHALGFTLLAVYEYYRTTVNNLNDLQRAAGGSDELREIASMQADLVRESWYGIVSDVARTVTFDQPRAALWTAVFIAVLVRLNGSGPPRIQLGLSVLACGYCALLALLWFPFLYTLGSATVVALAATGVLLWAATRR
ncbi:hypothetical protein OG897_25530 [Streptomyces sp. NBC_00237]|uniref:hypothetical protein n=1 Tax=Streptomyces sp. NBC_00237 TaxID=2975687 RepID=UPI002255B39A|nr:hypothetical protein [Streptomyces sp. NBC_00237]MCX5204804.1 hypothetical protein [Streptomyces sp. NBC_00237]